MSSFINQRLLSLFTFYHLYFIVSTNTRLYFANSADPGSPFCGDCFYVIFMGCWVFSFLLYFA